MADTATASYVNVFGREVPIKEVLSYEADGTVTASVFGGTVITEAPRHAISIRFIRAEEW